MSKPTKTQAELIEMARAELKVHADCPNYGDSALNLPRTPSPRHPD
jgi:hypothetical protein